MNYSELRIYQIATKLRDELYQDLVRIHWSISEVNQALRSSASIAANIVEGHGRRFYPKDYYRFLTYSLSSSDETQEHMRVLLVKGQLTKEKAEYYQIEFKHLSIKILNFMNSLRKRHSNFYKRSRGN